MHKEKRNHMLACDICKKVTDSVMVADDLQHCRDCWEKTEYYKEESVDTQKTSKKMQYKEKLKDPRWQKKRLEVFNRDKWTCKICYGKENTLHVHHLNYEKYCQPWEYSIENLITLCEFCHKKETLKLKNELTPVIR